MSRTQVAYVPKNARENASNLKTPVGSPKRSHVRRLNFGQSLLGLNVVESVVEQKGNRLIIDSDVTKIPCTEKSEFVRKWIETHGQDRGRALHEDSLSTSPVLGSKKRPKTSPVLGHGRKRARRRINASDTSTRSVEDPGRSKDAQVSEQGSTFCSRAGQPLDSSDENSKENVFHQNTPVHSRTSDMEISSPVLVKDRSASLRNRKVRSQRKPLALVACNYMDTNMNSVIMKQDLSIRRYSGMDCKILSTEKQDMLLKKLEMDMEEEKSDCGVQETIKNFCNSFSISSPLLEEKICISESQDVVESSLRIETGSSDQTKDLFEDAGDVDNDSDKTPSDIIEDINTQDMIFVQQSPRSINHSNEVLSKQSQRDQATLPSSSERISEVFTPANEVAEEESNKIGVISPILSPEGSDSEPIMSLTILDSCKKKRKAKKGSLSERLQTLINSQVSFVRIWRHQMKQTSKDSSPVRCVSVCIQKCKTYFNRQFSSGFVIDDPFNLLPPNQTEKVDPHSRECFHREIRLLTIPEIVGRIEIKSDSIVQIAPPWEILEDKKLFLRVTYLNKVSVSRKSDVPRARIRKRKRDTIVANDFDCPCISANELLKSCEARTSKPNVMESLFS